MFRIHIGIDPTFAHIGSLALTWHGLFSALAIFVAVIIVQRGLARAHWTLPRFDEVAFFTIIGGIAGARIFFLFDHPGYYLRHPLEAFAIQDGGLAIYGAIIGGFLTLAALSRIYGFAFKPLTDIVAPGLLVAQAIGRIGCAINGDAWGDPTSSRFAFIYTNPHALLPADLHGVPTHPYPIYDMLVCGVVLLVITRLARARPPAGVVFASYAVLYATGRFFISEVREERVWFWGLQQAQVISLVVLVIALVALALMLRDGDGDGDDGEREATVGAIGATSPPNPLSRGERGSETSQT